MKTKHTKLAIAIAIYFGGLGASQATDSLHQTILENHSELVYPTIKNQQTSPVKNMADAKIRFTDKYPEGRVIVQLKAGTQPKNFSAQFISTTAASDVKLIKSFPLHEGGKKANLANSQKPHLLVLESKKLKTQELITLLKRNPEVEIAEPDYWVYAQATTPNDPRFNELWGMHNTGQTGGTTDADIDAPEAWDRITGNGSVIVGIIDTGVDYNHPDLQANM